MTGFEGLDWDKPKQKIWKKRKKKSEL